MPVVVVEAEMEIHHLEVVLVEQVVAEMVEVDQVQVVI